MGGAGSESFVLMPAGMWPVALRGRTGGSAEQPHGHCGGAAADVALRLDIRLFSGIRCYFLGAWSLIILQ